MFSKNLSPLADAKVRRGSAGAQESGLSVSDLEDFRLAKSFSGFAIITGFQPNLTGLGDAVRINGAAVSPNFFALLGVRPMIGAGFAPDDNFLAGRFVVMLSHGFWQRRLDADFAAIGQTILLDKVAYRIAGVLPEDFQSPDGMNWELYRAASPRATPTNRTNRIFPVVARLNADLSTARAELTAIVFPIGSAVSNNKQGVQRFCCSIT